MVKMKIEAHSTHVKMMVTVTGKPKAALGMVCTKKASQHTCSDVRMKTYVIALGESTKSKLRTCSADMSTRQIAQSLSAHRCILSGGSVCDIHEEWLGCIHDKTIASPPKHDTWDARSYWLADAEPAQS